MTPNERAVIEAAQAFVHFTKESHLSLIVKLTKPEQEALKEWIATRQTLIVAVGELETAAVWTWKEIP